MMTMRCFIANGDALAAGPHTRTIILSYLQATFLAVESTNEYLLLYVRFYLSRNRPLYRRNIITHMSLLLFPKWFEL